MTRTLKKNNTHGIKELHEVLCINVLESIIKPGYRTDHSMICMTIKGNSSYKGKSYWKFNNSLLRDAEYVNIVKSTIESVKQQYLSSDQTVQDAPETETPININDQLFLDVLLMEVREKQFHIHRIKRSSIQHMKKKSYMISKS